MRRSGVRSSSAPPIEAAGAGLRTPKIRPFEIAGASIGHRSRVCPYGIPASTTIYCTVPYIVFADCPGVWIDSEGGAEWPAPGEISGGSILARSGLRMNWLIEKGFLRFSVLRTTSAHSLFYRGINREC